MRISRLILKNWRNFRDVDVNFAERAFLVGPNASGKSNFLDAFRFLRDIAKPGGGLQGSIVARGNVSKIRCLAARKEPDVEIGVEMSNGGSGPLWKYQIGITQQVRGYRQPILRYERVFTIAQVASEIHEVKDLLNAGLTAADVALPRTAPKEFKELPLFDALNSN